MDKRIKIRHVSEIESYSYFRARLKLKNGFKVDCVELENEWQIGEEISYSILPNSKQVLEVEIISSDKDL